MVPEQDQILIDQTLAGAVLKCRREIEDEARRKKAEATKKSAIPAENAHQQSAK